MKSFLFIALFALFASAFAIDTVKELDLDSYLGKWYQVYGNPVVFNTFEKDAVCVTATYSIRKDGKINVFNAQNTKVPGQGAKSITAYGEIPDSSVPGKLKVYFGGSPVGAPYWIVKLGPVVDGQYDYAVVTDGLKASLFVLARDVDTFNKKYDAEVNTFLKAEGFTHFYNHPIKTKFNEDCVYQEQMNVNLPGLPM